MTWRRGIPEPIACRWVARTSIDHLVWAIITRGSAWGTGSLDSMVPASIGCRVQPGRPRPGPPWGSTLLEYPALSGCIYKGWGVLQRRYPWGDWRMICFRGVAGMLPANSLGRQVVLRDDQHAKVMNQGVGWSLCWQCRLPIPRDPARSSPNGSLGTGLDYSRELAQFDQPQELGHVFAPQHLVSGCIVGWLGKSSRRICLSGLGRS